MIIIGENLNIMSKKIWAAFKHKDAQPIRDIALAQTEAGVDFIDVNLGPLRKGGAELMEWVVGLVREVSDLPLCLDTTNIEAIEAGLQACEGKALINSISARPDRMGALLPLAKKYGAGFIGLTLGEEGIPHDANERGLLAAHIFSESAMYGIDEKDIWIDPIALPVNSQQIQIQGCTEFVMMLSELTSQAKSTCGLSNVSNGIPGSLRGIVNRTYLIMLKRYGIYSVIADAFDKELHAIAKDSMPLIEALVHRVMDHEMVDVSSLSTEELGYVKTTKVLLGESLYTDLWLDA